jgi:dipeptidase E
VLELTALPSIKEERWVPMVQETDALLVGGGDPLYLCYWMRQSGLADLLHVVLVRSLPFSISKSRPARQVQCRFCHR